MFNVAAWVFRVFIKNNPHIKKITNELNEKYKQILLFIY